MPPETSPKPYSEKASAALHLLAFDVEPDEFSADLGLAPTSVTKGAWCYDTEGVVSSLDINEHLRHLLLLFLPVSAKIRELRPDATLVVSVRWEANAVSVGGGPLIAADCVSGLANLGAALVLEVFERNHS